MNINIFHLDQRVNYKVNFCNILVAICVDTKNY